MLKTFKKGLKEKNPGTKRKFDERQTKETKKKTQPNPFINFCSQKRKDVKKENPHLTSQEVTKKLSEIWKNMSSAEKEEFRHINQEKNHSDGAVTVEEAVIVEEAVTVEEAVIVEEATANQWGRATETPESDQRQLVSCPDCGLLSFNIDMISKHMNEVHATEAGTSVTNTRNTRRRRN